MEKSSNIFPVSVETFYSLWGLIGVIIPYVSHNIIFVLAFWMATCVPTVMSGRLQAVKLYFLSVASFDR